ncbi:MAG TPA: hypothetical protein VFE85_02305 [Woeseiaceae bacterium]|nr:hypothetical protein [Woeseiaceae bacterium]
MSRGTALTLAFLAHAPDSAAQVLEQLDAEEAAAFIDEIPARHAGAAVRHMSPWIAARCLELVSAERAAAILGNLAFHDSAGLLRLIDSRRHAAILDAMPASRARRLAAALSYPTGSIGAWIDPDVPSFATSATAADATKYLRQAQAASHVFLHHPESGRFAGAVPALSVLQRHAGTRLEELPLVPVTPLSSRASLASAAARDDWDEFLVLPVTGRNRTLVGGLSRASYRRGIGEVRRNRAVVSGSLGGQLLAAFGVTVNGLLRLLTHGQPPAAAGNEEQRDA